MKVVGENYNWRFLGDINSSEFSLNFRGKFKTMFAVARYLDIIWEILTL